MAHYPHRTSPDSPLRPVQRFKFGARYLSLYWHINRPAGAAYSLYWDDEINPVQHAMSDIEVFAALAEILERTGEAAS